MVIIVKYPLSYHNDNKTVYEGQSMMINIDELHLYVSIWVSFSSITLSEKKLSHIEYTQFSHNPKTRQSKHTDHISVWYTVQKSNRMLKEKQLRHHLLTRNAKKVNRIRREAQRERSQNGERHTG